MGFRIALDKWIHQKMQKFIFPVFFLLFALLTGCRGGFISSSPARGEIVMQALAGSGVGGRASLVQTGDKLRLAAELSGLAPGVHALSIRAADCQGETGEERALPVLVVDSAGNGRLTAYIDGLTLAGVAGRSLVVYASPDGLFGRRGVPLACGVINLR